MKIQRIEFLANLVMLEINPDVLEIANIYLERLLIPDDVDGDALHLAMASYHQMDVLLTWICKHLANPNKFGHIEKVNGELGLPVPLITTPLNYEPSVPLCFS